MSAALKSVDSLAGFPAHVPLSADNAVLQTFAIDHSSRAGAVPLAIARPCSSADIQDVVRWAGKAGVPLVPVSSGDGPRRRGDTVCDRPAVILDMSGMKKIINIDGQDAIAIIEPGVTFGEFDAALAPHGLRAFRPLATRASKSVLAAFLEREPMTVPGRHWDSADPLAAMEVVFGTGDLFRTGGAAMPGTIEENLKRGNRQMLSVGPMHTDFGRVIQGAQGALAVVSWASIYCQRIPTLEVPLFAGADSLDRVVALAYRLLRRRLAGQLFILNRHQFALLFAESFGHRETLIKELPAWVLYVELSAADYFPEEAIAYQTADLERDAAELGVAVTSELGGIAAPQFANRLKAHSMPPGPALGLAGHEVFCLTQLDKVQGLLDALDPSDVAQAGVYLQPMAHGVNAHCQITLLGQQGDEHALAVRARACAQKMAARGGFFSRPYHPWADVPFARDTAIVQMLARTKSLFDPNAVLQPGAQSLGGSL